MGAGDWSGQRGAGFPKTVLGVWFLCHEGLVLAKRKGEDISHRGITKGSQIVRGHVPKSLKIPRTYDGNRRLKDERSGKTLSAEHTENSFYD